MTTSIEGEGVPVRGWWWCQPLGVGLLLLGLGGCAQQLIRDEATAQLREGRYESAIKTLQDGVVQYPESVTLRAGLVAARSDAVARLVAQSTQERLRGQHDAAAATLERAGQLDPGNMRVADLQADLVHERRAQGVLQSAREMLAAGNRGGALAALQTALADMPRHAGLQALKRQLDAENQASAGDGYRLALAETRPISLDFRNAPLSSLLEALRDGSGISFVLDRDVPMDQRASVFIRTARVEDAIDLVLGAFQLSRRIVNARTVLIYPNTPEKHRQHREQVVRVFHLAHAEAKTTATLLQNMLRIQPPFVDERANLIALREPPEIVALAERLVALHDQGEAEVMLEVEVLEVKTSRLTELGVNFPSSFSLTPLAAQGQTGLTVDSFRSLDSSRVGLTVAGLMVNLRREVGDFNTLANPRIRTRSKQKATILIGDKVPVITTTAGANGFVSENVSYLDVGLKFDVEPTVSPDDEVTIKLGLEVSALAGEVRTAGGSVAYQIGTRNANTTLRLRDGETQVLGGLISNEDRATANRVPGLGDLPLAGRLFSSQKDDSRRTELVLAITPRILRSAARPDADQAVMWVGTENFTRPRMAPTHAVASASAPSGSVVSTTESAKQKAAAVPGTLSVSLKGPDQVKVGDVFTVAVHATSGLPLKGMPMDLRYSNKTLQVEGIAEGAYFKQSEAASSFTHAVNTSEGRVSVGLLSNAEGGVTGEGDVVLVRFKVLEAGKAELSFQKFEALGVNGVVPSTSPPVWSVQVP
ncbi:cohesin domain-containing protein [Hydrogenophaga sp.]|uniref:cohesin domain-containing protein n=1 Tax=Hydrogenophaga sp. TaxID=1904254 RepID=UPI003F722206